MPTFRIKAVETVELIYEVEADTIEEAITDVENGDAGESVVAIESPGIDIIAYTIEGQMGWNEAP